MVVLGNILTLESVLRSLVPFNSDDTIYSAEPWNKGSAAIVVPEPDTGGIPHEAQQYGLKYFLEVSVAREFLEDWKSGLNREPSSDELVERIIHYTIHDA